MFEKIKNLLLKNFGQEVVLRVEEHALQPILVIQKKHLVEIAFFLRDTEGCYFDFLSNITAVDYHPENRFTVVYHIASIPYQTQLTLKVELENDRNLRDLPEVPSVSSVWRTADWHEREAFDLMGIFFTDHPDLRRILLPDDWIGYPLRKDYEDAESYHGIAIK
ncbi:NADH-quinone oxidoreductase subunit C [Sphingobacterium sp. LRF_L2]|uniref:NADH-quinone oxidoreductase subunit C n=1 Tax=Sphingobacterium sp. LRF_L2 TaxID=3369421 RepID=UPI003F63D845